MPYAKGKGIKCFALFTISNEAVVATVEKAIPTDFAVEQFERLSFSIRQITVAMLDNARIHTSRKMQKQIGYWQQRDLLICCLPTNSPHSNIAETV